MDEKARSRSCARLTVQFRKVGLAVDLTSGLPYTSRLQSARSLRNLQVLSLKMRLFLKKKAIVEQEITSQARVMTNVCQGQTLCWDGPSANCSGSCGSSRGNIVLNFEHH